MYASRAHVWHCQCMTSTGSPARLLQECHTREVLSCRSSPQHFNSLELSDHFTWVENGRQLETGGFVVLHALCCHSPLSAACASDLCSAVPPEVHPPGAVWSAARCVDARSMSLLCQATWWTANSLAVEHGKYRRLAAINRITRVK